MSHVLTIRHSEKTVTEIHVLNVGERFPGFGGSSRDLVARKTASLITRQKSPWGWSDTEYEIGDAHVWAWIAHLVNGETEDGELIRVTAEIPSTEKK